MKVIIILVSVCMIVFNCYGQKPHIDTSSYKIWSSLSGGKISNNGDYVYYIIENHPVGENTIIVQSIDRLWKKDIVNASVATFTQDSRCLIVKVGDTVRIIKLGKDVIESINHVKSFALSRNGDRQWLALLMDEPTNKLVLHNCNNKEEVTIDRAGGYSFSEDGKSIVVTTDSLMNSKRFEILKWVDLASGKSTVCWQGQNVSNLVFNNANTAIGFISEDDSSDYRKRAIWYYVRGSKKSLLLADDQAVGIDSSLTIGSIVKFSGDDNRLFFKLQNREKGNGLKSESSPTIWRYSDEKLQSLTKKEGGQAHDFMSVININDQHIIQLQQTNEKIDLRDTWALVTHYIGSGDILEQEWSKSFRHLFFLMSVITGERKEILGNDVSSCGLSPSGKYLIFFDTVQHGYFSMNTNTKVIRNISKGLSHNWEIYKDQLMARRYPQANLAGWIKDDAAILLYKQNDIWQLDPDGRKAPFCLTNNYGRKNGVIFTIIANSSIDAIEPGSSLLLSAFNQKTKDNGFFTKKLGDHACPNLLSMGPYIYYFRYNQLGYSGEIPIKAKSTDIYLLTRMSAEHSLNYFITRDFKTFFSISDLHPEEKYNWMTSELVNWKTDDGIGYQGVLYKPEDFDSTKKYPLIFYYYERLSDNLHCYLQPKPSEGPINIPTFVSNGYLVFTPDIHYRIGYPGMSAIKSIVSAARYLARNNWVDSKKMGIQGHSFGGFETNYILTHTHLFAAACSASSICDLVSYYSELRSGDGRTGQHNIEFGQFQIEANLWQNQRLYLENSPILSAAYVRTPLLLMHTTQDGRVPFSQAVEFFTALRRLGKKAWLLQYDDGDHSIFGQPAFDYSIRMLQFFDYFLKGGKIPEWIVNP